MPSIDAVGDDFLKSALTARADACTPIYRAEYGPHFNRPYRFSSRHYIIKNLVASARNRYLEGIPPPTKIEFVKYQYLMTHTRFP
jgi:hypothetical protein